MKKTLLALAVLAVSGSAMACYNCNVNLTQTGRGGVVAGAAGTNSVTSGSAATAVSSGNGSSLSYAANRTLASSSVGVTGSALSNVAKNCDSLIAGAVGVRGDVSTFSESLAFNQSTGSGTGAAAAGGLAIANVAGAGEFSVRNQHGTVHGQVAGSASSLTAGGAIAGRNGEASTVGGNVAGFAVTADASMATQGSKVNTSGWICTTTTCGPAKADQKEATTSAFAYSDSFRDSSSTGLAAAGTLTGGKATGIATSGAKGGVSAALLSNATLGNTVPSNAQ